MGTIVVTGAAGHLGKILVRALLGAGHRVRALVHRSPRGLPECERALADVRDAGAVLAALSGADVVLHLAARISLEARDEAEMMAVQVEGTRNVIAACRAQGARLVHVSSIHAFDPAPLDAPIDESRALATEARHFAYDRSKALGEALVRASGLDTIIVNPTAMLGPEDDGPSEMGRFFQRLLCRTLPGLLAADFDWVDARDVAAQLVRFVDRATPGRYLLSGHRASLVELATQICAHAEVAPPRLVSPLWLARATAPFALGWARLRGTPPLYTPASLATLAHYRQIDGSLARRELGWTPRPLADTVADTVAWWRR